MREYIHKVAGGPVVLVFRKGGERFKEEIRCDSESDSREEVQAIFDLISLYLGGKVGPGAIGKGFVGFLPWEMDEFEKMPRGKDVKPTKESLHYGSPIRVADIVKNEQIGITYIYMESV